MEEKNVLFLCNCGSVEHQLIARYFEGDTDKEVYLSVYLSNGNFFKRLKYGLKYIFGHKSDKGAFEEFIFQKKDADNLQKIVKFLKK